MKSLTCGSTWVLNILASDLQPTCIRVAMGNKSVFCFVEIKTINNLHMTFFYYCACLTWNNIFSTGLHGKRSSMILNSFSCQILSPPPPAMFPNQANGQSHTAFLQDYFLCCSWEKIIINLCFKRIKHFSFPNTNSKQNSKFFDHPPTENALKQMYIFCTSGMSWLTNYLCKKKFTSSN